MRLRRDRESKAERRGQKRTLCTQRSDTNGVQRFSRNVCATSRFSYKSAGKDLKYASVKAGIEDDRMLYGK